ncbi:MAG: hypothetical protein AUH85_12545 [Chloroflexi bacterium 13_1_40CM_4_68_4]|nr:MAG: hypothetical protein AUH85_12545 [Chloroflexi bacterium 13_1_40CM_4_68_4]
MTEPAVRFEGATLEYQGRRVCALVAIVVFGVSAAGCSPRTGGPSAGPEGSAAPTMPVLGTENFYADLLQRVGASHVKASSLLNDPNADPHAFEASPQAAALVADARLVIVNGIGYVPQHHSFDADLPLRGRDLVQLGLDGHRWGLGLPNADTGRRVSEVIASVDAAPYADAALGRLSGGEQQRLRIAQALVGDPQLLLCDEPLANLDLRHQQEIADLIGGWQRRLGRTVLFVTHDVNPVLHLVDRVLFVVHGRWAAGTPDEVLTAERMTALYGSHVDVIRVHGRILVVGEATGSGFNIEEPHHIPDPDLSHPAPR